MKRIALALIGLLAVGTSVGIATPAQAATISGVPTVSTPNVPRGGSIRIYVDAHGSKIVGRTSTLWRNGGRIYDWSPSPGLYKTKSVITYQPRISTQTTTTLGARKSVTRSTYVRVYADETPGCVSRSEFRAVKDGMTQARVHSIFGTSGRVLSTGSAGTERHYTTCTGDREWSYVEVDYDPRVWFKWEYIELS